MGRPLQLLGLALLSASCGPRPADGLPPIEREARSAPVVPAPPPPAPRPPPPKPAPEPAPSITGVPECDDFLIKYSQCVAPRIPQSAQETFQRALDQWAESWRKSATTEAGRQAMAASCTQMMAAQKQAMKAYNCQW